MAPDAASDSHAVMRILGPTVFLQVTAGCMLLQSRPKLVLAALGGNSARSGILLGQLVSSSALLEFFINPVFGRMSDTFGRSAFLTTGCLAPTLLRFFVYLRPSSLFFLALDRVITPAVVTAWFSVMRASQTDTMTGEELAKAQGPVAVAAGLGVILGPFLDGFLARINPSLPFLGAGALSLAVTLVTKLAYKETLAITERKPMSWIDCNPFAFVKMLRLSRPVRLLMLTSGLQSFSEGRTITEINTVFCTNDVKMSSSGLTNFIASYGVTVLIGGIFGGKQIGALGLKMHTTVSNLANAIAFCLWGAATATRPWLLYASLAVGLIGQRKRDCVESLATTLSIAPHGPLGKGEVAASLSNFRALSAIAGPVAMGYLYAWATKNPAKRYMPGLPFYMVAALMLLAQGAFSMLSNTDLGLDANGVKKADAKKN